MLAPTSNYVYGFIFIAFINLFSQEAFAHTRSVSYSSWTMTNDEIVCSTMVSTTDLTTVFLMLSSVLKKPLL